MKAAVVAKKGGPLVIEERPIPDPGPHEVRIKVHACGVCHSDQFIVDAIWPGLTLPRIPGREVAGVVAAMGPEVRNLEAASLVEDLGRNGCLMLLAGTPDSITVKPGFLIAGRRRVQGWTSGQASDSTDTLRFAAQAKIRPLIEVFPLDQANEAYQKMIRRKVRYRAVLQMNS